MVCGACGQDEQEQAGLSRKFPIPRREMGSTPYPASSQEEWWQQEGGKRRGSTMKTHFSYMIGTDENGKPDSEPTSSSSTSEAQLQRPLRGYV